MFRCALVLIMFLSALHSLRVYLRFVQIDLGMSNAMCDFFSKCDPYFTICVKLLDDNSSCGLFYATTIKAAYNNRHQITFESRVGNLDNPIQFEVPSVKSALYLSISIYDHDMSALSWNPSTHLFTLGKTVRKLSAYPSVYLNDLVAGSTPNLMSYPGIVLHDQNGSKSVNMLFGLWLICPPRMFGPNCETMCDTSTNNTNQRFGCELSTGRKLCVPGWIGSKCDQIDRCATDHPCGPMGVCVNTPTGAECICKSPSSGPTCMHFDNACARTHELISEPFCLNRGVCVLSREQHHRCICQPGFTGTRCERDINECKHWSSLAQMADEEDSMRVPLTSIVCHTPGHEASPCCGPKSMCENTVGSYQCICPSGWTGLHCEYPPTLWPDGFAPPVNKSADYDIHLGNILVNITGRSMQAMSRTEMTISLVVASCAIVFVILVLIFFLIYCQVVARKREHELEELRESQALYIRSSSIGVPPEYLELRNRMNHEYANSVNGGIYFNTHIPQQPPDDKPETVYEDLTYGNQNWAAQTVYDFLDDKLEEYDSLGDMNDPKLTNNHKAIVLEDAEIWRTCPNQIQSDDTYETTPLFKED